MSWAFVLNGSAGSGCDEAWLRQHLPAMRSLGATDDRIVLAKDGEMLLNAVQVAVREGCTHVVAGGGDGTISSVAQVLAGTEVTLGVLPMGTLNHFAKDLGVPLETAPALKVLEQGRVAEIDVGEVNGEIFVNNASLGLYPRIVKGREQQQRRLGRGKWPAFAWAAWSTLRRFPFMDLRLKVGGLEAFHRTPFLFVGNNEYSMAGWRIGARERLDAGRLSLYLAPRTGRWGLVKLALRALAGTLRQAGDFLTLCTDEFRIDTPHALMRIATDGELRMMEPPLRFRIRPRALRVIVPASSG